MRIIEGATEARQSILRRQPTSGIELGAAGRARTREVFGADLSAVESVQRIIDDVRREGDTAVRRYCEAFDGVPYPRLEVPRRKLV